MEGKPIKINNLFSFRYLGIDVQKVRRCMGDPTADAENLILKAEQEAQV